MSAGPTVVDRDAFDELAHVYQGELRLHCYRMLGSVTDADDVLQETLLAAWQHLERFEGRSSPRAWLYRIATNRCLNAMRARRRGPPAPVPPFEPPPPSRLGDVTWLQPYPDAWLDVFQATDRTPGPAERTQAREQIRLAFIVALQRLPPRQTAAMILCDVLDFSSAEVASMLETTPTSVKGLLQRARAGVQRQAVERVPPAPLDADLAQRFADAFSADDVDTVVALLTDDAWLAMPPAPHEYHGRAAIAGFLHASAAGRRGQRLHLVPTRANGQAAFGCYLGVAREPSGIVVLTFDHDSIAGITRFLDSRLPALFGLHDTERPE